MVGRTYLLSHRIEDRLDGLGVEDWHCAAVNLNWPEMIKNVDFLVEFYALKWTQNSK